MNKVKIVNKADPMVEVKVGDVAYFDNDYWLICAKDNGHVSVTGSLIVSLTRPGVTHTIAFSDIVSYFSEKHAVIYDGSKSSLNLVLKKPVYFHKK